MSEPFVGEIRMFAGNFAPRGWAYCDGQLLAISQNDALFSLLGTNYGGDGRTTFALPDMRGRIPLEQGTGPGLSARRLGSKGGAEGVTLTTSQLASHTHDLNANTAIGNGDSPSGTVLATGGAIRMYTSASQSMDLNASVVQKTGAGSAHNNMMPTLCVNFIISLFGIYPSRH